MYWRVLHLFAVFSLAILIGITGIQLQPPEPAYAANGDFVHLTNFSSGCSSGIGVGIGFDGKYLWYSCYASSPDLFKADALSGNVLASYNVAGGLGALAWDGTRKKMWAGWGGGAGGSGAVRLIDTNTGTGPIVFNASQAAWEILDDGLAYDAQTDSLYISPDTSTLIYQYTNTGTFTGSFPWTGSGCYNSGVGIGGSLLFQGSDGCNHIWVINKVTKAPAFDFVTGLNGVRDEDLECDSVTFSPRTVMWSMEAYEPRRAMAYEIPPGSCGTGGGVDTDKDGLLDEWETSGVTIDPGNGAGPQFIDLPAMGADPNKQDIFLHIDWMQDATHNQQLSKNALQMVVNAFAAAPTPINLHIDEGPNSVNFPVALSKAHAVAYQANLGTSGAGGYNWSAFQTLKDANFTPTGRTPIFHYVVAAHNYGGGTSSGISRGIGASDLIVSLGSFTNGVGSDQEQAGTLMHELGHNLGLRHGGGDDINYKPNYASIMSYGFQMGGVIKNGRAGTLDYSRSNFGNLNENSMNEPAGLGAAAAGYGARHFCPGRGYVPVADATQPIDWNCNGVSTDNNVAFDTNNDGAKTNLAGFNDWANLQLKGGAIGLAGVAPQLPMSTDDDVFTPEMAAQVLPLPSADIKITVPSTVYMNAVSPNGAPVQYVVTAVDAADPSPAVSCDKPSGSVFPIGTTTVTCTASDGAGNTGGPATFKVVIFGAVDQLKQLQSVTTAYTSGLAPADAATLRGDVASALAAATAGDTGGACSALATFASDLQGPPGASLAASRVATLVKFDTNIRAVLGC